MAHINPVDAFGFGPAAVDLQCVLLQRVASITHHTVVIASFIVQVLCRRLLAFYYDNVYGEIGQQWKCGFCPQKIVQLKSSNCYTEKNYKTNLSTIQKAKTKVSMC